MVVVTPQTVVDLYDLLIDSDVLNIAGRVVNDKAEIVITDGGFSIDLHDDDD